MSKSRPRRLPFARSGRQDPAESAAGTASATTPQTTPATTPATTPVITTPAKTTPAGSTPAKTTDAESPAPPTTAPRTGGLRTWAPFMLVRAAHPRQALLTAVLLAAAAALAGRPGREVGLVLGTALVGQVVLGWHNDLVDQVADRAHERAGKPVADGRIGTDTVWFSLCCAVLLVVPLAIANGVAAGLSYLASVAVGMIGNVVLRRGVLSFVPWAIAFALYPAFLSYGGWGGGSHGAAPQPAMVALSALLGIGVHFLLALWGLVADNADGWTYLPLKLGLRMGATRLLVITCIYLAAVTAGLLVVAAEVGLRR